KENTGNFTYTFSFSFNISVWYPFPLSVSPNMHFVAKLAIVTPVILLKKGMVGLERGFTSITYTFSPSIINWILINPTTFNSFAILSLAFKLLSLTFSDNLCGG